MGRTKNFGDVLRKKIAETPGLREEIDAAKAETTMQLWDQFSRTEDKRLRAEILQTIREVVDPDCMLVNEAEHVELCRNWWEDAEHGRKITMDISGLAQRKKEIF